MEQDGATPAQPDSRPDLLFFYGRTSGRCRRVDGFLAQVLQRRQNHGTFNVVRLAVDDYPKLARQFGVSELPSILVVQGHIVRARVDCPRGRAMIEEALAPWLR
jgi:thioredoxin-like negative regulator of GroEL